ncbi:MAG: MFS transporter [Deltaproteobacteria bacterium]
MKLSKKWADPDRNNYGWFNAGVASWYLAWGMQGVLFSWLIIGDLGLGADKLGLAQMLATVPALVLVLLGGAVADRLDRRRLIIVLHLVAASTVAALAIGVGQGMLSYRLMVVFALATGTVMAFVLPTRDALLADVAGDNMMRAVAGMTITQWTSMGLGNLVAGSARWIGSAKALAAEALLMLVGVAAYAMLSVRSESPVSSVPAEAGTDAGVVRALREISEGVAEVLGYAQLRPVFVLEVAAGLLFMGPFLVLLPMLVRDVYNGDIGQLGGLMMAFPSGIIVGSIALLRRGGIRRKGLALLVAVAAEALALLAVGSGFAFWGLWAAVAAWGLAAAFTINVSRTVFQENASPSHRARVLSVYSLGLLGTAPMGSLLAGFLAARIGPQAACVASSLGMLTVLGFAVLLTPLLRIR